MRLEFELEGELLLLVIVRIEMASLVAAAAAAAEVPDASLPAAELEAQQPLVVGHTWTASFRSPGETLAASFSLLWMQKEEAEHLLFLVHMRKAASGKPGEASLPACPCSSRAGKQLLVTGHTTLTSFEPGPGAAVVALFPSADQQEKEKMGPPLLVVVYTRMASPEAVGGTPVALLPAARERELAVVVAFADAPGEVAVALCRGSGD